MRMEGFFLLVILLLLVVGAVAAAARVVRWIAEPIESLARARQARTQFTLADLLILFAMLQLAVGTIHYLTTSGREPGAMPSLQRGVFVVDGLAALIILCSWWCGVSMVSRAGVNQWWHRAIILAFVVPCGTLSVVAVIVLAIPGVVALANKPDQAPLILGIGCALAAVIGVCGQLTRWIAAKYPLDTPTKPPDSEQQSLNNAASVASRSPGGHAGG